MIRPNFPLEGDDMVRLAAAAVFSQSRRLLIEQILRQEAAIELAALGVPLERAGRITSTLGYHAVGGLAEAIARSGVTLDQIAEAITESRAELDQIAVKVTLDVPGSAFDPVMPTAVVTVSEDLALRGPIEVDADNANEQDPR